jgi:cell division septation protein DedD
MDEPALRDVERWKDKIEVRLDNRQVFFLFFGSAMVACMLFVLGVIVGKRLESRGRAEAPVVEDPLAALDRFADHAGAAGSVKTALPPALTFPKALLGSSTPGKPERAERTASKTTLTTTAPTAVPAVAALSTPPNKKLAALPRPMVAAPVAVAPAVAPEAKSEAKSEARATAPAPVKRVAVKPVLAKALPSAVQTAAPTATKIAKGTGAVAAPATLAPSATRADKAKGGFALQLSSFQDRAEADAFAHRFAAQNAHVVVSEIPGKGTWYRVRVGSYASMKDATSAKTGFEHDHGVIAYVAGSGPAQ